MTVGGGMGMGGQSQLDYEVYGYDFTETDSIAQKLVSILGNIEGTADIRVSRADYQPGISG